MTPGALPSRLAGTGRTSPQNFRGPGKVKSGPLLRPGALHSPFVLQTWKHKPQAPPGRPGQVRAAIAAIPGVMPKDLHSSVWLKAFPETSALFPPLAPKWGREARCFVAGLLYQVHRDLITTSRSNSGSPSPRVRVVARGLGVFLTTPLPPRYSRPGPEAARSPVSLEGPGRAARDPGNRGASRELKVTPASPASPAEARATWAPAGPRASSSPSRPRPWPAGKRGAPELPV